MRRTLTLITLLTAAMVVVTGNPAGAVAPTPSFTFLKPGGQPRLVEKVPVNVVFVGYEPGRVTRSAFTSGLARTYEPVVRSRLGYGVTEKLGITYTYDYRLTYTDRAYEDRFFGELSRLAKPAPLTQYQTAYNRQNSNVLDVTDNNAIDAPSVEKWLAFHPPSGVDTRRNTIFFVNWFGRPDFKFHVYTKIGEPDPDTGYDFGAQRDSRKLIAWGGTTADDEETGLGATRRVWFHDLSAGPESNTSNYIVDTKDLDDNGVEDYRMPPIWEYADGGYRAPAALAGDLALLTRYVALNLMMTTSPLYPVELPAANLPHSINIDSNTYEGWPGVDASEQYIKPKLLLEELSDLRWRNQFDFDNQDLPYDSRARECYVEELADVSCYPDLDFPAFANLFLYNQENLERTKDDVGRVDYEVPLFNYAVGAGVGVPALGYADDDWQTGDQSYVFNFVSPEVVTSGYGLTTTQIHETGHHLGLSHPHDGYDSATGVDYGPADERYFAWAGDEGNSMMSYIDVNWDFSQFDRDNSDRFLTAAYYEGANRLAADVLADRKARLATADLRAADVLLGLAKAAFAAHGYRTAYALAERAYDRVVAGARRVGIDPASAARSMAAEADTARRADSDLHSPHEFIDTLAPDSPRSQP